MCLRQAKAVSIEGHPEPDFNGVYAHDSTHEGWPVLKNANGKYCYRYTGGLYSPPPWDRWFLNGKFKGQFGIIDKFLAPVAAYRSIRLICGRPIVRAVTVVKRD